MFRRLPIATQVLLLVALGVLLAAGSMVAITLRGPPPRQPPVELSSIDAALSGIEDTGPARLRVEHSAAPPQVRHYTESPELARRLAALRGDTISRLRAYTEEPVGPLRDMLFTDFIVVRQDDDGSWTTVRRGPDRALANWQRVTFSTIGGVLLVILLLAWLASRRIVQPIEDLGRVARLSHTGSAWTLDPPGGPPEIAAAARELRDLHERNRKHAEQQLTMLAAIAHDVGTPLARIAFRNERLPDADRQASLRDIDTIRQLLSDSMTLARGWSGEMEVLDLAVLAGGVVDRVTGTGGEATFVADSPAFVTGNALSLERMVQNLVDNAIRYGGNASVRVGDDAICVWLDVCDGGPGFPDLPQEQLLSPFMRGEGSRNAASGGSGLGLAIVSQVVARHGGTIELGQSGAGGARVTVRLPLARVGKA